LRKRILDFTRDARLDRDIGLGDDETEALKRIDTFLCELKEAQIRDGLHIFGQSPQGRLERDLAVALARVPRGEAPGEASLIRALADDLKLGFDPLTAKLGDEWHGPSVGTPLPPSGGFEPGRRQDRSGGAILGEKAMRATLEWQGGSAKPVEGAAPRTIGDIVEHLEHLAAALVDGTRTPEADWTAT